MGDIIEILTSTQFLFTAIRMMTPILFAALACHVFIKGGVDPIGTEGIMLITTLAAVLGGNFSGSVIGGVLTSIITGSFFGILYVLITNKLKTNEILTGIAFNMFAGGGTVFLLYFITGERGSSQSIASPMVPNIKFLNGWLGDIVSGHNFLTYFGLLLVVILYLMLFKTPLGIKIRAVGENSKASESVGIPVLRTKYMTAIIAGGLIGLGGAYMSMAYVNGFSRDMVAGRGFIGMAAEGMGRGNPFGVLIASFIFGMSDSLAIRLQLYNIPARLVQIIPYALTIIVITIYSGISLNRKNRKITKGE